MPEWKSFSRTVVLGGVVAMGAALWVAGTAAQQQQSNFVGGNPTSLDAAAVRTLRLRFPAGSRSNWHTHTHGQLLMVEQGRSLTQVRGGPLLAKGPGEPWWTAAGIEHWHGAAPDTDVVQLTIYEGTVNWLEPVTDAVYKANPQRSGN